ncbi:hypothetical protein OH77DRAFT_679902 [Trametes cingulata]|nr:hypothetical protein OH77DRAFT_679902 [Trametes cingulata]
MILQNLDVLHQSRSSTPLLRHSVAGSTASRSCIVDQAQESPAEQSHIGSDQERQATQAPVSSTPDEGPLSTSSCLQQADMFTRDSGVHRELTTAVPAVEVSAAGAKAPPQGKVSWHCRFCRISACVVPIATVCGHIFCKTCITREVALSGCCPVCRKMFLLRLDVGA